jgi:putative ABC transport system permease protein
MERLYEIWDSISRNKLRTFLTGFSVAWGIFMLVILLGVVSGLKNGFTAEFEDDAINSIFISRGQTSLPHDGLKPGRQIKFTNADYDFFRDRLPGVEKISARMENWQGMNVVYKNQSSSYRMRGVHPDHQYVEKTILTCGRYINETDILQRRKVIAVGTVIKDELFKGEDPLGKWLSVNGISFLVVGIYKDEGAENENKIIYIPITTAQATFNGKNEISRILFTMGNADLEETKRIAEQSTKILAERHRFDAEDKRAIYVRNNYESYVRIISVVKGMEMFMWVIGVMTIIAGIVGVSNIMLITVKERTREIGIRKALGAKPLSIVGMIMQESVIITSVFGYLGLLGGILLMEGIGKMVPKEGTMFSNPEVQIDVAVTATVLLVIAGALAGFFPAMGAASIKPIEALRDE